MHTSILDMLRNCIGQNLTLIGNSIELDLLATVHELADYHRMLLRNRRGQ